MQRSTFARLTSALRGEAPASVSPLAVLVLALLWTALVRAPFFYAVEIDDPFYGAVAALWRHGYLPYRDAFDVKPPGIFALTALAQSVFGPGLASLRAVAIVSDAITSACLFYMGLRLRAPAAGLLAALLCAPLSLLVIANAAYSPLCALTTLAFAAALAPWRLTSRAACAGAALGAAFCVKQTAAFEAVALLAIFIAAAPTLGERWRAVAAFVLSGALVPLACLLYFVAHGAGGALVQATLLDALARSNSPLENLTFLQGVARAPRKLMGVYPLLIGAAYAFTRRERVLAGAAPLFAAWITAAFASLLVQHALIAAYAAPLIPPTLLLSALAAVTVAPARPALRWAPAAAMAGAALIFAARWPADRLDARAPDEANAQAGAYLRAQSSPGDRLYVVNHGPWLYAAAGLAPPTPFISGLTTLCELLPGGDKRLADIFDARPRFVVVGDRRWGSVCELPARWDYVEARLKRDYRAVRTFATDREIYEIYERLAPSTASAD